MATAPAAALPDRVDLETAPQALATVRAALAAAPGALDCTGLRQFDSAAVAVLVALRREARGPLRLQGAPPNLRKLAALYGVDALLFGPPA
jgi:phospholipid transport system transporter-binding protein